MKINLTTAPSAVTADSIAVVWDKAPQTEYAVYLNGVFDGTTKRGDYTAEGLKADTEYITEVYALNESGEKNLLIGKISVSTRKKGKVISVTDFGAVGDGKTLNTAAIQAAIDECPCGGTVMIPQGVFVSGALYLKSDITLHLSEGAVLLGSENPNDYPIRKYRFEGREEPCYCSLINTVFDTNSRLKNIVIEGKGKIDASGAVLNKKERAENKGSRGRAVCIRNTDGLYIKDVTVKQSPAWCVHTIYCTDVSLNNVKIYTRYDEDREKIYEGMINGDGFDPDSCKNVYVFNSMIASQDDCIAIKSGRDKEGREIGIPTENVRITDCRFENGLGVVIGSEASGSVRNVLVRDCTYTHVYSAASIKTPRGRGGVIENVTYENISGEYQDKEFKDCEWFRGAIYLDHFYSVVSFDPNKEEAVNDGTPKIRNISFKNITYKSCASNAIYMAGLPESPLENISFENVKVNGKFGLKAYNVVNLRMNGVTVEAELEKEPVVVNVTERA